MNIPRKRSEKAAGAGRRRGVSVLEATLVLPVVLALIFGAIEFAYVFYVKQTLQAASREGARHGALASSDDATVKQAVEDAMKSGGLGGATYEVSITNASTGASSSVDSIAAGTGVCVEVSAPWTQFSVFLSGFGDWSRADLRSRTVMRREN